MELGDDTRRYVDPGRAIGFVHRERRGNLSLQTFETKRIVLHQYFLQQE